MQAARLGVAGDVCRLLFLGGQLLQGGGASRLARGISLVFILERDRRADLLQFKKELGAADQINLSDFVGLNDRLGVDGAVGLLLARFGNQLKEITVGVAGHGLTLLRIDLLDLEKVA